MEKSKLDSQLINKENSKNIQLELEKIRPAVVEKANLVIIIILEEIVVVVIEVEDNLAFVVEIMLEDDLEINRAMVIEIMKEMKLP